MKNRIITNSLRTIKNSFPRFLSLLVMSMLGVFVFSGLSATGPDMINTLDKYLKDYNTYDIKIVSTMGLTQSDVEYLENKKSLKDVEEFYSKDILVSLKENSTINVTSLPKDVNLLELTSGEYPKNKNEIIVEDRLLIKNDLKIGDTIILEDEVFSDSSFKIVGTVNSSLYFNNVNTSQSRGTTSVGTGVINYYSYVLSENFNVDYYTNIYLTLNENYKTGSKEYVNLVKTNKKNLEKIKSEREQNRYDEIYNEALSDIQNEEAKANKELQDNKNKLDNYGLELKNSKNELDNASNDLSAFKNTLGQGKENLDNSKSKLDNTKQELDNYKNILDETNNTLNNFKLELESAKQELDNYKSELESAKELLDTSREQYLNILEENNIDEDSIDSNIEQLNSGISALELLLSTIDENSNMYAYYSSQLDDLYNSLELLNTLKNKKLELDLAYEEYNNNLNKYNELYNTYLENIDKYNGGLEEYESNISKYNESYSLYNEGLTNYNNGLNEYNKNLNTYNESYNTYKLNLDKYNNAYYEYNNNLNKYYSEKEKVEKEIEDAYKKLDDIKMPKWYIFDRNDNSTYTEYIDDTNSIMNLSKVFPLLFFAVAVLISLISMNRMVEETRGEIGTLKSLGFSNIHILNKYLIFSFLATFLGVIIGGLLGVVIIPLMIFKIYKVLFELPPLILNLNLKYTIIGFIIATICICGTTIYTAMHELKTKPSQLIRPKVPKSGKRIILERFKFWNKIKFSKKVTIRNIFRYKKRVLVTIFGIAGCTALIVCGFGIKDSIVDIAYTQYGKIFNYDAMVYVNDTVDDEIFNDSKIKTKVNIENINAKANDYEVNMFIAENNEELRKIVNLKDMNGNKVNLEKGKVVVTEKFATLSKLNIGDTVNIIDTDNNTYEYEISNIVENHINHYIFMDKETFEESNEKFNYNVIFIRTKDLTNKQKDNLSSELLKNDSIINVIFVSKLIDTVLHMLDSLDQVVFILIVLASLLAFVVLYNLSNINISERKREIATLKVLGFYNKEVDNYITKENIFLSIIGVFIGLFLGYFLTNIVISTVEIEKCRFIRGISFNSYLYSAIIALSFTFIVDFVTHFTLKRIDMIESLKSVE